MNIYTIHDSMAKYYLPIFLARTDDEATRMFAQGMGDGYVHRGDYTLISLGIFDQEEGEIRPWSSPLHVINGLSLAESYFPPDANQLRLPIDGADPERQPEEQIQ